MPKLHFSYATRWKIDCDYLKKLNPSEKAWYLQFLEEFYTGKKFLKNLIENKKESYQRQNAAQRCMMTQRFKCQEEPTVNPIREEDLTF